MLESETRGPKLSMPGVWLLPGSIHPELGTQCLLGWGEGGKHFLVKRK